MTTENDSTRTRGGGEGSDSGEGTDVGAPGLSDPQEIAFLPRREGRQWSLAEVEREIRDFLQAADDAEADAAGRTWRLARKLDEIYNGFPERAKGKLDFVSWFSEATGWSPSSIYAYLRIQKVFRTDEEARAYGRNRLERAALLMPLLKVETLATLEKASLPQPDGKPIVFAPPKGKRATVTQLDDAITLLRKGVTAKQQIEAAEATQPADDDTSTEASERRLQRLIAERDEKNEKLRVGLVNTPGLEELNSRFVVSDGKLYFEAGRLLAAQAAMLFKLVAKIDR